MERRLGKRGLVSGYRGHAGGYEDDDEVEIDCEIRSDNLSKNAICIYTGNSVKVAGLEQEVYHWIPRSVLIEIRDDRKAVLVQRWFAEKKGLV